MQKVDKRESSLVKGGLGWTYTVKCSQCSWSESMNYIGLLSALYVIGYLNNLKTSHEQQHGFYA